MEEKKKIIIIFVAIVIGLIFIWSLLSNSNDVKQPTSIVKLPTVRLTYAQPTTTRPTITIAKQTTTRPTITIAKQTTTRPTTTIIKPTIAQTTIVRPIPALPPNTLQFFDGDNFQGNLLKTYNATDLNLGSTTGNYLYDIPNISSVKSIRWNIPGLTQMFSANSFKYNNYSNNPFFWDNLMPSNSTSIPVIPNRINEIVSIYVN